MKTAYIASKIIGLPTLYLTDLHAIADVHEATVSSLPVAAEETRFLNEETSDSIVVQTTIHRF